MQNEQSSYWMQWYGSQISPFKTEVLSSHMPRALSADSLKLRPSQELPSAKWSCLALTHPRERTQPLTGQCRVQRSGPFASIKNISERSSQGLEFPMD